MDKAVFLGFIIEIVRKMEGQKGFQDLPRRWVVERTFAWMTAGGVSCAIMSNASTSPKP